MITLMYPLVVMFNCEFFYAGYVGCIMKMELGCHTCHNKLSTASCLSSVVLCVCFIFLNSLCSLCVYFHNELHIRGFIIYSVKRMKV